MYINQLRVPTDIQSTSDCALCRIAVDAANIYMYVKTENSGPKN
jgi:hypothetical protein